MVLASSPRVEEFDDGNNSSYGPFVISSDARSVDLFLFELGKQGVEGLEQGICGNALS